MLAFDLHGSAKRKIEKAVDELKDKLAKGHWHGEHEGKKICGEISGLEKAANIVTDALKELETLEDDEEDDA